MNLIALPAFTDNYIWMLHDGRRAIVVDPGESVPVQQALDAAGLALAGLLITHHHADHTGGIDALRDRLPEDHLAVWGPAGESIPRPFVPLQQGDGFGVLGSHANVLDVPGHTAGHIAYFMPAPDAERGDAPILFCGDTLFSAGCGRLFEGTAAQMHASLAKLAALPDATRVCCAHEYTLSNLRFAAAVEPGNAALAAHARHCATLRAGGQPTLPSTIALERAINPFMRCDQPAVIEAARRQGAVNDSPPAVLAALREWKNHFQ